MVWAGSEGFFFPLKVGMGFRRWEGLDYHSFMKFMRECLGVSRSVFCFFVTNKANMSTCPLCCFVQSVSEFKNDTDVSMDNAFI